LLAPVAHEQDVVMALASWQLQIAYALFLVWVVAGFVDFACHRRSDLPHTSGLAESMAHLFQLAVIGVAVVLVLALEATRPLVLAVLALVLLHAVAGYVDTRIAFRRGRVITPLEQHVHSVLDIAPWAGWGTLAAVAAWGDGSLQLRSPTVPPMGWGIVLVPSVLLCVVPALFEYAAARRAARRA
jgi:hypothetical protein